MTSIPRPATVPAVVAGECVSSDLEVMVGDVVARSPWGRFGRVFGPDTDGEAVVSEEELLARLADAEGLITQLRGGAGPVAAGAAGAAPGHAAAGDGAGGSCPRLVHAGVL